MTRVLAELLDADAGGAIFRQRLKQLEIMAGHPNVDIRLTSEIQHGVRAKLHGLGLDVHDTTGPELYAALGERLHTDEKQFAAAIKARADDYSSTDNISDDPIAHLAHVLEQNISPRSCFALKSTVAKRLLKAQLPKKTMKALGYRSVESMLKHETAPALYAAAWMSETEQWTKRLVAAYAKLKATDFEARELSIQHPTSKRWQMLSDGALAIKKHSVLNFKELGAVVLLPLPAQKPPLATLMTAVLTLHAVNQIRAAGTFMKLHQVSPNFGSIVQQVVLGEPMLPSQSLDAPVSWHSLHQYFARFGQSVRTDLFEPVVAAEELAWTTVEDALSAIEPSMSFWKHSAHLAFLQDSQTVSCNLTDALLSHCNHLRFEQRVLHYFRESLRSELVLRYFSHDKLEQSVLGNLQPQLVPQEATI